MINVVQILRAQRQGGIEQVAYSYSLILNKSNNHNMTTIVDGPHFLVKKFNENSEAVFAKKVSNPLFWILMPNFFHVMRVMMRSDLCVLHTSSGRHLVHLVNFIRFFLKSRKLISIGVMHNDSRIAKRHYYDYLFAINETQAQQLEEKGYDRFFRFPNPLSISISGSEFSEKPFQHYPKYWVIGVIANLTEKKNVSLALLAFKELRDQIIDNGLGLDQVQMAIFGDGPLKSQLEKLAFEIGVSEYVRFHGFVEDRLLIYSQIDLLWSPSNVEPFGLVMIEAMAFGRPVIATQTHGSMTIKKHIDGIVVLDKNEPKNFSLATLALLEHQNLHLICASLRQHVLNEFGPDVSAERFSHFNKLMLENEGMN